MGRAPATLRTPEVVVCRAGPVSLQERSQGSASAGEVAAPPAGGAATGRARQARAMAVNAAMMEVMDREFGRLVAHLQRIGAYDDTLFVILADNGPVVARSRLRSFAGKASFVAGLVPGLRPFLGGLWAVTADSSPPLLCVKAPAVAGCLHIWCNFGAVCTKYVGCALSAR